VSYCRSSTWVRTGASVYAWADVFGEWVCAHPQWNVPYGDGCDIWKLGICPHTKRDTRFGPKYVFRFKTLHGFARHMERHYQRGECPRYAIRRIKQELKEAKPGRRGK
jgi:hypothetical protein